MSVSLYEGMDVDRRLRLALERGESVFLVAAVSSGLSTYLEKLQANPPKGLRLLRVDLRKHSSPIEATLELARQTVGRDFSGKTLESVAQRIQPEQRRKLVVILDHLDALDDSGKIKVLSDARNLQGRSKGDGLNFILAGSINPKRLNQLINNSPVENRSNRLQLPALTFAEIDRMITLECEHQLLDKNQLSEALRRKLFDLAGDDLSLLKELVRALPFGFGSSANFDTLLQNCVDEVLGEEPGRQLIARLQKLDDNHFRTLAYVLSGWSPEIEPSFYHASDDHVDLCLAGVLQRTEDSGRLRFRNELIPMLLVRSAGLKERLRPALMTQGRSFEETIHFHSARSHSLVIAFNRCHQIELMLRQFVAGLGLRLGESVIDELLSSVRISMPRDAVAAFQSRPEIAELPDAQKNAQIKAYAEILKQRMGTLRQELLRRRKEDDGSEPEGAVSLLAYLTIAEAGGLITSLSKEPKLRGGPPALHEAMEEIARAADEFRPLRNRVAHHRVLSLHEHQQLSTIQQRLGRAMFKVGALIERI